MTGFPSCIVVGAGPIGLFTARALASAGCTVTLFDDGRRGAGWASGGMLAAVYETLASKDFPEAARSFAFESQRIWGRYLEAMSVPYVSSSVFVARNAHEQEALLQLADMCHQRGVAMPVCALPADVVGLVAWSCAADIAINPRTVLKLLMDDCVNLGVKVKRGSASHVEANKVQLSSGETLVADQIIVTTGLTKLAIPELACLRPVKGQMQAVSVSGALPRHVTRAGRIYLIPRDRQIVIGATSQPDETVVNVFDKAAHAALLQEACALMPKLARAQVTESWAGIRPKTPDGLPLVGYSEIPGVILATGAYRNGWLLAAGIAKAVMGLVLSGPEVAKNLQPFAPKRFPT